MSKPDTRTRYAVLLAVGLCVAVLLYTVDPLRSAWYPPCPIHKLTGLDCPGCGSARGLHALLHGQILTAADYNLLLLPALLLLASGFYYKISGRGYRVWQVLNKPKLAFLIICCFWLLRNIPVYPLTWLSSGR